MMNFHSRRTRFWLTFGVTGSLVGIVIKLLTLYWPALPTVSWSFFITWWLAALVGYLLISKHE